MRPLRVVDLFCGAGGTSSGVLRAARKAGRRIKLTAINHWKTAINTHSLNHPGVEHICGDVESIDPRVVVKSGRLDILLASCECRFHSNARGGGVCDEQSRSQAWQLIRWITDLDVACLMMENVREFLDWGPLNPRTQRPIKSRKSEFFKSFVSTLEGLGYTVEWKIQCAADFGDATSRKRLILMARKRGSVVWPKPSHGDGRKKPWRPAREIIDWSIKGINLSDRKKPLCKNTMKRLEAGLIKFGGANAELFIMVLNGIRDRQLSSSAHPVSEPLPAVTCSGHLKLVEPFVIGQQSCAAPRSVAEPLPTVCTKGAIQIVEPFILPPEGYYGGNTAKNVDQPLITVTASRGRAIQLVEPWVQYLAQPGGNAAARRHSIDKPTPTVVSKQNMLLVEPLVLKYYKTGACKPVSQPLDTVTTKARFMLVEFESGKEVAEIGIRTRMLQPKEIGASHSFDKAYVFTGTKEEQTKQIGNSVPVLLSMAHALVMIKKGRK